MLQKNLLFIAVFVLSASLFPATHSGASTPVLHGKPKKPETMTTLNVVNLGGGSAYASWTSVPPTGNFLVTVFNSDTGLREQQFSTTNYNTTITGLSLQTHYRIIVGDINMLYADIYTKF